MSSKKRTLNVLPVLASIKLGLSCSHTDIKYSRGMEIVSVMPASNGLIVMDLVYIISQRY